LHCLQPGGQGVLFSFENMDRGLGIIVEHKVAGGADSHWYVYWRHEGQLYAANETAIAGSTALPVAPNEAMEILAGMLHLRCADAGL